MTDPDSSEQSLQKAQTAPDPDDPRKASDPRDLSKPTRKFILKNTVREFLDDECTDIAAGLTYYAVLSLFPGILALISILGLVGKAETTTSTVLGMLDDLGVGSTMVNTIEPVLGQLTQNESAGFALVAGLVLAIWSASGYVNSFGRAMNRIYEIDEGRPIWKLRPMMLLVTVVLLILAVATALALVVSGPVAEVIGGAGGLSDVAVTVWGIAKWPVLLAIVILMVAILYHYTPNVRQPKFHWVSPGAVVGILTWVVASAAFGFYVANFGSYNKTYGALGGAISLLVWLWITNLAVLFGQELNAEIERGRELTAGLPAERDLQLEPRGAPKPGPARATST